MQSNRAVLEARLRALAEEFAQLGGWLADAGTELQQNGRPIPVLMVAQLNAAQADFADLRQEVLALADSFSLTTPEDLTDLQALENVLHLVAQAEEEGRRLAEERRRAEEEERRRQEEERRRQEEERRRAEEEARRRAEEEARRAAEEAARAAAEAERRAAAARARQQTLDLLNRVLRLAHRTKPDFPPLAECQVQAERLRGTVASLSGDVTPLEEQTLAEAQRPFIALLYLVEEWNNLDGDRWDELREEVTGYFGKELAAQAARGQMIFTEAPAVEVISLTPEPEPPAPAPEPPPREGLASFFSFAQEAPQVNPPDEAYEQAPIAAPEPPKPDNQGNSGPLPLWFSRLRDFDEGPDEPAAGPPIFRVEMPIETLSAAAGQTEAPFEQPPVQEPGSTLAQVALSHWSRLLEDLSVAETAAQERTNAQPASQFAESAEPAPPARERRKEKALEKAAESGVALSAPSGERIGKQQRTADPPAVFRNFAPEPEADSGDEGALLNELLDGIAPKLTTAEDFALITEAMPIPDLASSAPIRTTGPLAPPPPPPPPPPPLKRFDATPTSAHDLAALPLPPEPEPEPEPEPYQEYETIQAEADEQEQTQYYLGLEEAQAPFYFASEPVKALYHFPHDVPAGAIATAITNGTALERARALRDLTWRLFFEEQFGLAFFLARALERQHKGVRPCLPSWAIRVAALGRAVRYDDGELARQLKNDLRFFNRHWIETESAEWNCVLTMITAAAGLRAALLAPSSRAARVLLQLPTQLGLEQFALYCRTVAGARLPEPGLYKQPKDQMTWTADWVALRRAVESWWKQAPFLEMDFQPATYVWRNWVEPQGALRALLPAQLSETGELTELKAQIKQWADERYVRRAVEHTDRDMIGRPAGQKDIADEPLKQILAHTQTAVALARRWVYLLETKPEQQQKPAAARAQAAALRQALAPLQDNALAEFEALTRNHPSICLLSALSLCREAVRGVDALLDETRPLPPYEPAVRSLLYAPLLAAPLELDWRWKPVTQEPEAIINALLKTAVRGLPPDWTNVFTQRSEARDHQATARILEHLETLDAEQALLDDLRHDREQQLNNCRSVLRLEVEETRKLIAAALDYGYLPEKDYLKMAATIDELETAKLLRFGEAHRALQGLRDTLVAKREGSITAVKEKLKLSGIGPDHFYHAQICRVLERGDIVTAEDYLAMVLDQQELPEGEEVKDSLAGFYPDKARELSEYLKQVPLYAVIQRARAGADLCGLRLRDYDLDTVAQAIFSWFNSRRMQTITEEDISKILPFLGLAAKEVQIKAEGAQVWIELKMDSIFGRERCPVPAYGSEAKGKYRILCVWNRPSEEELLQLVGDTALSSPVIVFYFGQMNDDMRPALARLCRERRQTVTVIDDVLILYLYGQRAPRLRTVFECTLPFSWTEPYTATQVAPEMFYGRVQERKAIMNPTGSGFVYGGRRLGKTALLRDVERTFHNPQEGRIAVFLDLEGENIGTQRQLDDLWLLLGEELKRLKVVSGSYNNPISLLDQICEWLEANQQRRILVLLDQADRFLEADEKEQFVRASRLRGVMEKTNRRFKVVFAGVHNIPRMTRVADHPLAQFGTPLSIGPLLGHEAPEARKLIEEPLAALGYRFESPDLVRRILWRTNYYPSLVQHYCYHLLKYLTNPGRIGASGAPPYLISSEDIDETYRGQDLRAAIRAGLLLTLQVDERYGVIAYAMADAVVHNGEEALTTGFPVSWIAQQVSYWWAEGFQSVLAENGLPVLLDEMIGLGILRATEQGYTLRSKGVALLLGNEDQIAAELQRTRKTPQKYNPSTFRAARTGSPRRSPLTAQEILELRSREHGVSIIFGGEAANLPDLREFMEVASPRGFFVLFEQPSRDSFIKQLNDLVNRAQDGTTLVLISHAAQWDDQWIEDSLKRLGELTSRRSYVRIAFVADPAKAWEIVGRQQTPFELFPGKGVTTYSLKPWHDDALRQWLDDRSFNVDEQGRERITTVTGNWPMLLEYFYQRSQVDSFHWLDHLRATAKDLKDKPVARDLARALGVDQAALSREGSVDVKRVLLALDAHGEQSVEELFKGLNTVAGIISEDAIKRVLWWAELLSLASRVGPRWRVDALVGRVLKTVSS